MVGGAAIPIRKLSVGPYTVFEEFASGGMATVHLARVDTESGPRIVAVKRLLPHLRQEDDFANQLLDEARLAACVHHENVVDALDVLRTSDELLLVMEYVAGPSLTELLRACRSRPDDTTSALPATAAVSIAVSVLRGLHAAHTATSPDGRPLMLVHRDVSPQNVLLSLEGIAKIADFGIAKAVGRLRSTRDGALKGKIAYMSPEQVASEPLDARSDVYSVAVVLWEMLAGRPMFDAENDLDLFGRVMSGGAPDIATVVPSVPAAVSVAMRRALSRDPRRRQPSAAAFADALEAAVPVSPSAVAELIASVSLPRLAERARFVASIERGDDDRAPAETAADKAEPAVLAHHARASDELAPEGRAGARFAYGPALALGAALVVLVLYLAWGAARSTDADRDLANDPARASAVGPTSAAILPGPSTVVPPETAVPSTGSAEAADYSEETPPPAAASPTSTSTARRAPPRGPKSPASSATTRLPSRANCDPPHWIDGDGVRHFKKECFR